MEGPYLNVQFIATTRNLFPIYGLLTLGSHEARFNSLCGCAQNRTANQSDEQQVKLGACLKFFPKVDSVIYWISLYLVDKATSSAKAFTAGYVVCLLDDDSIQTGFAVLFSG